MGCLQPYDRDELLKGYIDNAKINVTHIYLAQLLFNGYVDYVLTVNFDNLMLRALSLFNVFPSTYDMAILKDLTTTKFKEKSIVYLHGQHHGVWLLNTDEEMKKVSTTVPRIFDSIKNKRPWVFIGYSGKDQRRERKEHYYQQAFDKFQKATDLNPDDHEAIYNWGTALVELGNSKEGDRKEHYYQQAIDKFQKAIDCGGSLYNLSCLYALQGATKNALKYLEISLSKGEIGADFVKNDTDWGNYSENEDFILLLEKYK